MGKLIAVFLLTLVCPLPATADGSQSLGSKHAPDLFSFDTRHVGSFGGASLNYQAKISNFLLKKNNGDVFAEAILASYIVDEESEARPITFIFNGGPGSASTWLHMGLMGPKRVRVPSDASDPGLPPYKLEHNSAALLDLTDLVFIDPIGTGFSRLAGKGTAEDVFGLEEDASSVAAMVREWIRREKRWNSPVFIAGESFGTTRAAAMMPYLQQGSEPIRVSGIIMVSQAMDYTGSTPVNDNLIAFATYLPSLAATAWYHRALAEQPEDFEKFVNEVRAFTVETYLPALFRGAYLSAIEADQIAEKLAGYTGIEKSYFIKSRLRIPTGRFAKELLREQGAIVGRLDSRYTSKDVDVMAENPRFDAASAAISAAYSSSFRAYLDEELGVSLDRPYFSSGPDVGANWVYDRRSGYREPAFVNTAPTLADAMARNPNLKVLVASGYYDLITPFFDAEFTLARHGIDFSRVKMTYYHAGHMMYVHEPAFEQLTKDMRQFVLEILNEQDGD